MVSGEPPQRPTLGVVAICKNEEHDMPGFLAHLIPWVDEIAIVDDHSSDSTCAIVEAAGPKVKWIEHPMEPGEGFAGQRNIGIASATTDWILHMDVDMRVPQDLAYEIVEAINDPSKDAWRFRLHNFTLHRATRGGGAQYWNKPWLARRSKHHFDRSLHEVCSVESKPERVGQLEAKMWHLNDENYLERMRKSFQYCQLEAEKIAFRVRWYHLFFHPIKSFMIQYILYRGYLDGTVGLIFALHGACARFRVLAIAWDRQNTRPRPVIDAYESPKRTAKAPARRNSMRMSKKDAR